MIMVDDEIESLRIRDRDRRYWGVGIQAGMVTGTNLILLFCRLKEGFMSTLRGMDVCQWILD